MTMPKCLQLIQLIFDAMLGWYPSTTEGFKLPRTEFDESNELDKASGGLLLFKTRNKHPLCSTDIVCSYLT